jgi:hypothetical protein
MWQWSVVSHGGGAGHYGSAVGVSAAALQVPAGEAGAEALPAGVLVLAAPFVAAQWHNCGTTAQCASCCLESHQALTAAYRIR